MTTFAKDGVIDYPIADGMSLAGVWNYVPNANGPSLSAKQGYLSITRGVTAANNQWTMFSIGHTLSVAGGCAIQFEVKYDQISPATEVKLTLASDLILRYDGSTFNYCWYQNNFHQIGRSTIRIADGAYHQVILCLWPAGIAIFEDGNFIGKWDTSVSASVTPHFDWQILSSSSSLNAQLRSILLIPATFAPGVGTPWDIAFSNSVIPPADIWEISKQKGDPIPISFSAEGFMRAETSSLNIRNSWVYPQVTVPMTAFGLVMYRFRVNTASGSETKITLLGNNILRITGNGSHLEWDKYTNLTFVKLSDSSIRVGGGWTVVTMVYSQTSISLFEDGVYKYTQAYSDSGKPWEAYFWVQHLDAGTAVSVDLSNVRCVPLRKTAEMLIRDLQPTLLAYYPLKVDITEAICTIPALDLTSFGGYIPKFVKGKFGNAADFSGQGGALKLPLYPYGRSFPSYTLSLWAKVDSFPAQKAGLVGPLSVRSDGKLEFSFIYSDVRSYKETVFISHAPISRGQWVSVVVTYAYEESRFAIFLDGVLDSIVYTIQDNSSQAAVLPMYGYVGATAVGGSLNVLDGQIGDVFFFRQHIHNAIALALANKPVMGLEREKRALFIPLLLPAFLILVYAAVSTAVIAATLKETEPDTPELEDVVNRIVQQVGSPARPGAQVSRSNIGITDNYPITLDIGGEGPLNVSGLVTGFDKAINVNETDNVTVGGGGKIPYLVKVASWSTDPGYPFADNFADQIVMMGCPLTPKNADEMVRVIKPTGTIDVWVDNSYLGTFEDMARRLKSYVRTPDELVRFSHNGIAWFTRRQIVANKNGHDEL